MKSCKLISITGPSGVGKTTISKLISCIFDNSLIISGDDSHRWDRYSDNWKQFTHLDPAANNLEEEKTQLKQLKDMKLIERKLYNHDTGLFDDPITLEPKDVIIYEGLHTLYDNELRDLADVKIFIDTDEMLKTEWKTKRDTLKRGYTVEHVIETIKKRLPDEEKYILPQKQYADIIIKIVKLKSKKQEDIIKLIFIDQTNKNLNLIKLIKKNYNKILSFIKYSKKIGSNSKLTQNIGGNTSLKFEDKMIISSSGINLADIQMFENFCIYKIDHPLTCLFKYGRPSMEMDAHLHLNKATIHTHPIELLTILCSTEAESVIDELYFNFNYSYFNYVTPGFDTGAILSNHLNSSQKEIIFIQNHGIFASSLSFEKSFNLTKKINYLAKKYLLSRKKQIKNIMQTDGILFPDAAVNKKNNKSINDIIYNKIIECGLTPNFLSLEQIEKLINLEQEKYRINMVLNENNIR